MLVMTRDHQFVIPCCQKYSEQVYYSYAVLSTCATQTDQSKRNYMLRR